jgi:hypothetical protein
MGCNAGLDTKLRIASLMKSPYQRAFSNFDGLGRGMRNSYNSVFDSRVIPSAVMGTRKVLPNSNCA